MLNAVSLKITLWSRNDHYFLDEETDKSHRAVWTRTFTQDFLTQKPSSRTARRFLLPLWSEGTFGAIQFRLQHRNAFYNFPGNPLSESLTRCLGIHCPLLPEPLPRQLYLCLPSGSTMIFIQLQPSLPPVTGACWCDRFFQGSSSYVCSPSIPAFQKTPPSVAETTQGVQLLLGVHVSRSLCDGKS